MMRAKIPPPPVPPNGWLATITSDGGEVYFAWDGNLYSSDPEMMRHLRAMAANIGIVSATPTGPFALPDFAVGHAAYALVARLAEATGGKLSVKGVGWQWPSGPGAPGGVPADSARDAVY